MFGCICAGRPVQTNLVTISPTQFVFSLPSPSVLNHLVVFLLPDAVLPLTHGATVHIRFPGQEAFTFLGAISANKPSAIFKVSGVASGAEQGDEAVLGISVEEASVVEAQIAASAGVLVKADQGRKVTTLVLAQRIITNAFNYLSSFAEGRVGEEAVKMKRFQEWWQKFEKKVELDPSFLEKAEGP